MQALANQQLLILAFLLYQLVRQAENVVNKILYICFQLVMCQLIMVQKVIKTYKTDYNFNSSFHAMPISDIAPYFLDAGIEPL